MVLRVKLEVVPFGDEDKAYEIGRLDIFNKGLVVDGGRFTAYGVLNLCKGHEGEYDGNVHHIRSEGAWELLRKTLTIFRPEGP